jgi:Mg2+ and Co2+ transporter CorA
VSGFYGMNIIVNERTDPIQIIVICGLLAVTMLLTFRWARRQGWW